MQNPEPRKLGLDDRFLLLSLARETLRRSAENQELSGVPGCRIPPALTETAGCFVTLTRLGELRGCIGNVEARWPLWRAVVENTRAAALEDTRFPPVAPDEVEGLDIEISVLTPPSRLHYGSPGELLARLDPQRDGVVLEVGPRRATFLPQVWARLPEKLRFMSQLAVKAGLSRDDWQLGSAVVSTYQVEHFSERDFRGA